MRSVSRKFTLIVEQSKGDVWGRIAINDNLIVEKAASLESLKTKVKKLIYKFEKVKIAEFRISYDLTAFFDEHSYLNVSEIATRTGINKTLMRQYVAGIKFPSAERLHAIQDSIRQIGRELSKTTLHRA